MIHQPRSCASCDETACAMHRQLEALRDPAERTSWVLDDVWPETASMVAATLGANDQLISPGILEAWPRRYNWPKSNRHFATIASVRRHWAMRRVAKASGAVRQQAYLEHDRLVARQLGRRIDYRSQHLVVAQSWLPWLDEAGVFGGRSFDVIMSRYPFGEIHRLLDEAAHEIGASATIGDFRAPSQLVEREAELLRRAKRIYTPHAGIAALFPEQAVRLAWHRPAQESPRSGIRVAFIGPTIARQRPDIARRLCGKLSEPLIVIGPIIEPAWEGMTIERRAYGPNWLNGIGSIIHPATMTNQPRALLEAQAAGVAIYATNRCGLDPADYLPLEQFGKNRLD